MQAIICGDSLKILGTLKSGSVDLVITDPPYNVELRYNPNAKGKKSRKCAWGDKLPEDQYWSWFKKIFTEVYRVMGPGSLYVSHSDQGVYLAQPILKDTRVKFVQNIIWWGPNGFNKHNASHHWILRHETIMFFYKGDPPPLYRNGKGIWYTSVIKVPRPQTNYKEKRLHPAQKPIKLYTTLIQRTPGQLVLDPFSGRGTTAQACRFLKRDYIVIDKYPEYCEMARQDIPWKK